MTNRPPITERRRHARTPLVRPVKVQCPHSGKYYHAQTRDTSAGGLLIEMQGPAPPPVIGQKLAIGVAWSSRQMLLTRNDMSPVTVVRSVSMADKLHLAVQFDRHQELARSA